MKKFAYIGQPITMVEREKLMSLNNFSSMPKKWLAGNLEETLIDTECDIVSIPTSMALICANNNSRMVISEIITNNK